MNRWRETTTTSRSWRRGTKTGLDIAVLFRTSPVHTIENFEPEYANYLCQAWNDWMADFCKADAKRLKGSALITLHDVDLALQESKRALKVCSQQS